MLTSELSNAKDAVALEKSDETSIILYSSPPINLHSLASITRTMGVGCQLGRCSAWSIKLDFALAFLFSVWHEPRRVGAEHNHLEHE